MILFGYQNLEFDLHTNGIWLLATWQLSSNSHTLYFIHIVLMIVTHSIALLTPQVVKSSNQLVPFPFMRKCKAEATNGASFKQDVWNGVAALMASQPTEGGEKTVAVCKTKWISVRATLKCCGNYTITQAD